MLGWLGAIFAILLAALLIQQGVIPPVVGEIIVQTIGTVLAALPKVLLFTVLLIGGLLFALFYPGL